MIVSVSYWAIEYIYGTILPILKIFITLLKLIQFLSLFILNLLIISLLNVVNFKLIK